jgi:hypothetical protein
MRATLPDGRVLIWSPDPPYLAGDPALVARVRAWLDRLEEVNVTPSGPLVPADVADRLAVFTAVRAVAPIADWQPDPTDD